MYPPSNSALGIDLPAATIAAFLRLYSPSCRRQTVVSDRGRAAAIETGEAGAGLPARRPIILDPTTSFAAAS
jgi:hypothetical protein